jgi:ATP-dependent Lhr-like helicase
MSISQTRIGSWVLDFIRRGGPSLTAYPGFRRVAPDPKGVWRAADRYVVLRHKVNIGAIVSDASVMVQYGPAPRGAKLGAVEESFVARMKAGDNFWFAGRSLEFVRLRDQIAFVRAACGGGATPRWQGGRMPLSTTLADAMLDAFVRVGDDHYEEPELAAARPLIEVQRKWSTFRGDDEIARGLASLPLSLRRPRHSPRSHELDRVASGA